MTIELIVILSLIMGICVHSAVSIYILKRMQLYSTQKIEEVFSGLSVIYADNRNANSINNTCLKYTLVVLLEIVQQCKDEAAESEEYELAEKYNDLIQQINQLINTNIYNQQ